MPNFSPARLKRITLNAKLNLAVSNLSCDGASKRKFNLALAAAHANRRNSALRLAILFHELSRINRGKLIAAFSSELERAPADYVLVKRLKEAIEYANNARDKHSLGFELKVASAKRDEDVDAAFLNLLSYRLGQAGHEAHAGNVLRLQLSGVDTGESWVEFHKTLKDRHISVLDRASDKLLLHSRAIGITGNLSKVSQAAARFKQVLELYYQPQPPRSSRTGHAASELVEPVAPIDTYVSYFTKQMPVSTELSARRELLQGILLHGVNGNLSKFNSNAHPRDELVKVAKFIHYHAENALAHATHEHILLDDRVREVHENLKSFTRKLID